MTEMQSNSIYWYDLETTGAEPAVDRVVQFAGVRTDIDLNIISEPLNIYCLPGNDTLPQPEAILVHGIGYKMLARQGLTEAEFIRRIHQEFILPNTCVAGFNNVRFDDEFTRNLLYRNFYDPYQREWQNGNSRWDIIDVFRMAQALRPAGFIWPEGEDNKVTFRLERLTEANGIGHAAAHDAHSDVLATIEVTKKLRQAQPKLYDYLFNLRNKQRVIRQLYPLGKSPVVHVSSMYPVLRGCLAVVLPICVHPTNPNGIICFNLEQDPRPLLSLSAAEIRGILFTPSADLPAETERVALKTIHINRCPALAPLSTLGGHEERLALDMALYKTHITMIQRSAGLVDKLKEVFTRSQFETLDDPDLMLYQGGFFSNRDKSVMAEVRQAPPDRLMSFEHQFKDERLAEMLFRYKARNYPASLTGSEQSRWDTYRSAMFKGEQGPASRLARFEALFRDNPQASCLPEWQAYLKQLMDYVQ